MPGKVFSLDSCNSDLAVVTSGKKLIVYDINNLSQPKWDSAQYENNPNNPKDNDLSLNKQLTKVKCFPYGGGCVVGGVDGRCWVKFFQEYFSMIGNC